MEDEIIYPGLEEQKKFERQKAPSDLLSNIAELSKNASTLHLLYVGVLIYWALTILGISDRQLVFNEQARLPIVGINVPLSGFHHNRSIASYGVFYLFLSTLPSFNKGDHLS